MAGPEELEKTGAIVHRLYLFRQTPHNFIELLILKLIFKDEEKNLNVSSKGCNFRNAS